MIEYFPGGLVVLLAIGQGIVAWRISKMRDYWKDRCVFYEHRANDGTGWTSYPIDSPKW